MNSKTLASLTLLFYVLASGTLNAQTKLDVKIIREAVASKSEAPLKAYQETLEKEKQPLALDVAVARVLLHGIRVSRLPVEEDAYDAIPPWAKSTADRIRASEGNPVKLAQLTANSAEFAVTFSAGMKKREIRSVTRAIIEGFCEYFPHFYPFCD